MPVVNAIGGFSEEMTGWRRHLHQHPELSLDCHETAAFVVEKLRAFGVDNIETGVAVSGVVAVIEGQGPGPVTALRADMDALPILEATGAEWASTVPGKMHACGHDGHTSMLLGAAKHLAETRNFAGKVVLLFQPAEETVGGGRMMVEEGVMDRYGVEEVYGLHTDPSAPLGVFRTTPGPMLAAVDDFSITITGKGGHVAHPQKARDPIPCAVAIVQAIQTLVTREADPMESIVAAVTVFNAGSAPNVIPETATLSGTIRSFSPALRKQTELRLRAILDGMAAAHAVEVTLEFLPGYPPVINHAAQTDFAAKIANAVSGLVETDLQPDMGAEDFSYMLEARPGAFLMLGQGVGPMVHHPSFDFNDDAAPIGASFFASLIETRHALAQ